MPSSRTIARLIGRGVLGALLALALAVAGVSFLTACRCDEPLVGPKVIDAPPPPNSPTAPSDPAALPVTPPPANLKDN